MQSIETLRAYYAAFNAEDWAAMLACVHDDAVHFPNQGAARKGKEVFREFVVHNAQAYDEELTDLVLFASEGGQDRAAAEFLVNGTYLEADQGSPPPMARNTNFPAARFSK